MLIWREKMDVVGLLFVDCLPRITPEGGTEAILGTNPIAVGIPSNTVPLLFDMSTAAITNGDLLVAMQEALQLLKGSPLIRRVSQRQMLMRR